MWQRLFAPPGFLLPSPIVDGNALERITGALLVVLLASIVSGEISERRARQAGEVDAQAALARGQLYYRVGGRWRSRSLIAMELAERRFGIEIIPSGCCPTRCQSAYNSVYNEVMLQHFLSRWGFDPVDQIFAEADDEGC